LLALNWWGRSANWNSLLASDKYVWQHLPDGDVCCKDCLLLACCRCTTKKHGGGISWAMGLAMGVWKKDASMLGGSKSAVFERMYIMKRPHY